MLDYILNKLAEQQSAQETEKPEDVVQEQEIDTSDEAFDNIMEYALMFQEMEELTPEGSLDEDPTEIRTVTNALDAGEMGDEEIPSMDDEEAEIESVEMNLGDGRVTSVPMDASIMESTNYIGMKTREDFVQEAYECLTPFVRDTEASFRMRVEEYADEKYQEYQNEIIRESDFGGKIDITDPAIPYEVTIDFGEIGGSRKNEHYYQTIPIRWQTVGDNGKTIMKKQLEAFQVFSKLGTFTRFSDKGPELLKDRFDFGKKAFFDVVKPVAIYIPIDPMDQYVIGVGFTSLSGGEEVSIVTRCNVKETSEMFKQNEINPSKIENDDQFELSDFDDASKFITKSEIEMEAAFLADIADRRARLDRFAPNHLVQEGIDFGDGNDASAGDATAADTNDAPPTEDAAGTDTAGDATTEENPDAGKVEVDTNDVSNKIVQKIADQENGGTGEDTPDVDAPVEDASAEPAEDATTDIPEDGATDGENVDIDAELNDLDTSAGDAADTDAAVDDMGASQDFDNMTIDELLAQGTEKLKGMSLNQIKDFISGGMAVEYATTVQEAVEKTGDKIVDKIAKDTDKLIDENIDKKEKEADETVADMYKGASGKEANDIKQESVDISELEAELDAMIQEASQDYDAFSDPMNFDEDGVFTEAFIITKGNATKAIDKSIRNCLGVLNDSKMKFAQIVHKFKKCGKSLNRVLSKAVKMRDVFSDDDIKEMNDLNVKTVDAIKMIGSISTVDQLKNTLSPFMTQAQKVSGITSSKLGVNNTKKEG